MRDSEVDARGATYAMLGALVKGCEEVPIYTCPVASAMAPWVSQVFAAHRNEGVHAMHQQVFPESPSGAFVEAVEYVRSEVGKLHREQDKRPTTT